jgi:shikimate dehydrogenase
VSERNRLGVVGWPVGHSRSPRMQNAALHAVGLDDWRYQLLPVPPDLFDTTIPALPAVGFRGVNVTIPHKEAALEVSDQASPTAEAIGAANTLVFEDDGAISAENTDAPALLAALPVSADGATALVLGAGGSARAAVWALIQAGAEVRIWNRTAARAQELAARLGATAVDEMRPADLLINCTSIGLSDGGPLKHLPLGADEIAMFGCVIDFVYSASETELIRAARSAGRPYVDGLDLLVGQGALSFEHFTGMAAPVERMRAATSGDG